MTDALQARTLTRLEEVSSGGLTRRLAAPSGIDLSSNDYLRLADDERLKAAAVKAVYRDGVGSTGSRPS